MPSQASTLIVPVENQVRELDAKLLLACVAAERGFPVVLGSRSFLHFQAASLRRGVYLAKSMRHLSEKMFGILCDLGHEIAAWDEEALLRVPDEAYWARRLSARAMQRVGMLFAWGPDDARAFREFPGTPGIPIHVTGNPRGDMLRPDLRAYFEPEVQELHKRFGPMLLVNTNFGFANHWVPALRADASRPPGSDDFFAGFGAFRQRVFERFREMIPYLAEAFPDLTIVVRPHPVERHETWREAARGAPNVRVIHEGNVVPWLMASELLIQNGCTTAIEAALLDRSVVSYCPVTSERFDLPLVEALSEPARDIDALFALVNRMLAEGLRPADPTRRRRVIERHVAALDGPLASDRIVDRLVEAGYRDAQPPVSPVRRLVGRVRNRLRTRSKRAKELSPGHRNSAAYHDHRFPAIGADRLQERVGRLARQLGRFERVRVQAVSEHVFAIDGVR